MNNRSEDRVVVYSAAEKKFCWALLEGFRARHAGIELEFVDGISVALHERHVEWLKAGEPEADVLWSSAMDLQMSLVLAGEALPYRSPEAQALPAGAVYGDMAYATTVEPLVTLVNRERFDTGIPAGSLAEITSALRDDPARFRGRVASYDIEHNGLGFLALLYESMHGDDFRSFLSVLAECGTTVHGSNPALVAEVASGRAAVGYHVLGAYASRAVLDHPSLAIAASNAPALAISRVAFISRRASHPNAAKLFLDHLLSVEGQQSLAEAGFIPIRTNADTDSIAPSSQRELAPIRIDRDFERLLDEERRRDLLDRWQAAVAAQSEGRIQ